MKLKNKVVIITGASSGIGLELARQLVKIGAKVYNLDQNEPQKTLPETVFLQTDVTNYQSINNSLSKIPTPIDILINNAGVIRRGTLFDTTEKEFDLLFDVNVKGSWLVIKLAKPHLTEKATILQISSGHALNPEPDTGIYSVTKQTTLV